MKGVWHGRGAEMLQLSGEVRQEDFFKLCDNINPATGEHLTARTDADRRVMTDLTFDVPKSVSAGADGRHGGKAMHASCVRSANRCAKRWPKSKPNVQTRVRKGRSERGPRNRQHDLGGAHSPHDEAGGWTIPDLTPASRPRDRF